MDTGREIVRNNRFHFLHCVAWHEGNRIIEGDSLIAIAIAQPDREAVARQLSRLPVDTCSLYLKTHSFHWNVTGPPINTLEVAAPGSYSPFADPTWLKEATGAPDWKPRVAQRAEGHWTAATAREAFRAAEKGDDEGTADMVTGRLQDHEKGVLTPPLACRGRLGGGRSAGHGEQQPSSTARPQMTLSPCL